MVILVYILNISDSGSITYPQRCLPAAIFLISSGRVNMTLYGVAMVTCELQPVPEANDES